jgi:Fe-S cluster assembly iron-binding protein IscA
VLEITRGAAALLTELRQGQDVPEDYGLRVFPETNQPGEVTIGLGFTDQPAAGDQVAEQEGMKVFVAQELASPLEDAAIDVTRENGTPQLVFRPKGENGTAPAQA